MCDRATRAFVEAMRGGLRGRAAMRGGAGDPLGTRAGDQY